MFGGLNYESFGIIKNKFVTFVNFGLLSTMKAKNEPTRVVRIKEKTVVKIEKIKDKIGIPIGKFFELAAEEKLKRESK